MAKRHTTIRLSELADRQLDDLKAAWGCTGTEVFSIALDRAHREEFEMARFKFRRDTSVYNGDEEIELMVLQEQPTTTFYLGRKRGKSGQWLYATATYDENAHQFRHNEWFANGRTYGAFEYVCQWARGIPASARKATGPA